MNKLRLSFMAVMLTVLGIIGAKAEGVIISVPEGLTGDPGATITIPVNIDNQEDGLEVIGFQMDFTIPESFAFITNEKGDKPVISLNYELNYKEASISSAFVDNDKTHARSASFNMENEPLSELAGELLSYQVILPEEPGEYTLGISKIEVSMDDLSARNPADFTFTVTVALAEITNLEQYDADLEALATAKAEYETWLTHYTEEGYAKYIDADAQAAIVSAFEGLDTMLQTARDEAETTRDYSCPDFQAKLDSVNADVEALWEAMMAAYAAVQEKVEEELAPAFAALEECNQMLGDIANDYDGYYDEEAYAELEAKVAEFESGTLATLYYEGLAGEEITCPTEEADAIVAEVTAFKDEANYNKAFASIEQYNDVLEQVSEDFFALIEEYEGYYTQEESDELEAAIYAYLEDVQAAFDAAMAGDYDSDLTEQTAALEEAYSTFETTVKEAKAAKMAADYQADADLLAEVKKTVEEGIAGLNDNYPAYVDADTEAALTELLAECTDLLAANKDALDQTGEYQVIASAIQNVADIYDEYELNVLTEVNDIMEAADDAADEYRAKIEDLTNEVDALADKYYAADVNAEAVENIKAEIAALSQEVESAIDTAVADKTTYVAPADSKFEAIAAEITTVADDATKAWADNAMEYYKNDIADLSINIAQEATEYAGYYDEAKLQALEESLSSCKEKADAAYEAALAGDIETFATLESELGDAINELVMANRAFVTEAAMAKAEEEANRLIEPYEDALNRWAYQIEEYIPDTYAGYYTEDEYAALTEALDAANDVLVEAYEAALIGNFAEYEEALNNTIEALANQVTDFETVAMTAKNDAQVKAYEADLAAVNELKAYADEELDGIAENHPAYADAEQADAIKEKIAALAAAVAQAYGDYQKTGIYTSPLGNKVELAYEDVDTYVLAALEAENEAYERAYDASLDDRNKVEEMTAQLADAAQKYAGKYEESERAALQQALIKADKEITAAFNKAVDDNADYVSQAAALSDLQAQIDAFIAKAAQTTGLQLTIAEGMRVAGRTLYNANGENVAVYTANGTLVYMGNDTTVTLPGKGIYVVKSGNKAIKANVR